MNKKAIFDYCGWEMDKGLGYPDSETGEWKYLEQKYTIDSNDMVLAMNKMVENDDWLTFIEWVYQKEEPPLRVSYFITWLMQPNRFFELMSEALEKGVIGK
jgi:hypothetical protein